MEFWEGLCQPIMFIQKILVMLLFALPNRFQLFCPFQTDWTLTRSFSVSRACLISESMLWGALTTEGV